MTASCSESAAAATSASSVTSGSSSDRPVCTTFVRGWVPRGSGGQVASARASSASIGSAYAMAIRRSPPSGSSMSILHQSARNGTATLRALGRDAGRLLARQQLAPLQLASLALGDVVEGDRARDDAPVAVTDGRGAVEEGRAHAVAPHDVDLLARHHLPGVDGARERPLLGPIRTAVGVKPALLLVSRQSRRQGAAEDLLDLPVAVKNPA